MVWLDRLVAGMLAPLAVWVLASGLDDLFLDLCAIYFRVAGVWRRRRRPPCTAGGAPEPAETRIALLIPAWREDGVIAQMLDYNLRAIRYSNYQVFVGVYPNDLRTLARVQAAGKKLARVHYVVCPHDGPTSKADCLNWVYQGMLSYEESQGSRFDVILHHDAEDLIHPKSLQWINYYAERYDMVQMPVLPLPLPWWKLTYGTYCDDFAQSHLRDLHVRAKLGGFLPSCGVGTAYRRRALDRVAWNNAGQPFQPSSLTEDYRIGLELHRLGCSQILLDAGRLEADQSLAATREYFPRRFWSAVRQRSRWVAGIALQSWQEMGWRAGEGQLYWLWRDRKGLAGNPLTILANLIFLYGLARWAGACATGADWGLAQLLGGARWLWWMLLANTGLIVARQAARAACVWRGYGWQHALISPVRSVWGNLINFAATVEALRLFAGAWIRRQALGWVKTDHSYPAHAMALAPRRRLGEILVELRFLPALKIELALQFQQPGERVGECLVRLGILSELAVSTALRIQERERQPEDLRI